MARFEGSHEISQWKRHQGRRGDGPDGSFTGEWNMDIAVVFHAWSSNAHILSIHMSTGVFVESHNQ